MALTSADAPALMAAGSYACRRRPRPSVSDGSRRGLEGGGRASRGAVGLAGQALASFPVGGRGRRGRARAGSPRGGSDPGCRGRTRVGGRAGPGGLCGAHAIADRGACGVASSRGAAGLLSVPDLVRGLAVDGGPRRRLDRRGAGPRPSDRCRLVSCHGGRQRRGRRRPGVVHQRRRGRGRRRRAGRGVRGVGGNRRSVSGRWDRTDVSLRHRARHGGCDHRRRRRDGAGCGRGRFVAGVRASGSRGGRRAGAPADRGGDRAVLLWVRDRGRPRHRDRGDGSGLCVRRRRSLRDGPRESVGGIAGREALRRRRGRGCRDVLSRCLRWRVGFVVRGVAVCRADCAGRGGHRR